MRLREAKRGSWVAMFLAALIRALAKAFPTLFTEYSLLLLFDLEPRAGASCPVAGGTTCNGRPRGRWIGSGCCCDGGCVAAAGTGGGTELGFGKVPGWPCDNACDNA